MLDLDASMNVMPLSLFNHELGLSNLHDIDIIKPIRHKIGSLGTY